MGPTAWKTYFAGNLPAVVATALPVGHPPILRQASIILGPPARWIAPSTPPPPRNPEFAAVTIATTWTSTIFPRISASVTPLIVRVDIKISSIYNNKLNGSSNHRLTSCKKRAAVAPSIARWSDESVTFIRSPATTWPSTTTGVGGIEPIAGIADSGGLMTAVKIFTYKNPRLLMVKVPP